MYVYIETEKGLYTVGFFHPVTNQFMPESDWDNAWEARYRVSLLNGGTPQ